MPFNNIMFMIYVRPLQKTEETALIYYISSYIYHHLCFYKLDQHYYICKNVMGE